MTWVSQAEEFRFEEYEPGAVASFRKTKRPEGLTASDEFFGGLSNMASGFPVMVNDIAIRTSEALYQALRFPERQELQHLVIAQNSPMTAKMKSKVYRDLHTREDWDDVRVDVMRWCLRVKLAQNWQTFGDLLRKTGDRPIVEDSRKDDFWGAKPTEDGELLCGRNVLGKLLMELRDELNGENPERLKTVEPLDIPNFVLYGHAIERVLAPERGGGNSAAKAEGSQPLVQAPLRLHTAQ